ncbi:MAG TPA: PKD domain-containing protein [Chitinophaga sp.]
MNVPIDAPVWRSYLLTSLIFFLFPAYLVAQVPLSYYRDTTTRAYSDAAGMHVEGQHIYWWGSGTGKYDLKQPVAYKLDADGNQVWNTATDSLLGFMGAMTSAFAGTDAIYCFGRTPQSIPFLAKVDKQTGKVLYRRDSIPVDGKDAFRKEMNGPDSIRMFYVYYDGSISRDRVYSYSFSTATGLFSSTPELLTCGIDGPGIGAPIYLDSTVTYYNVHEPDYSYSIKKKNRQTNALIWSSPVSKPLQGLYQEDGLDYFFTNNLVWCIADSSGTGVWAAPLNTAYYYDFAFNDCKTLGDTLYIAWSQPYSGSIKQYAMLTKMNKKTGQVYWNGAIGDTEGVGDYTGYFKKPTMVVDEKGDLYLAGFLETLSGEEKYLKKIAGKDGKQLYEVKVPVDTLPGEQYTVSAWEPVTSFNSAFSINGKLTFLLANRVTDKRTNGGHLNFFRLENNNTGAFSRKVYDNNLYRFPSTTLTMQSFKEHFYIVRRVGAEVYLEKYKQSMQLVWKKQLATGIYFTPDKFAIDSLGNICILGLSERTPQTFVKLLSSNDYTTLMLMLDSSGTLLKRHDGYLSAGQLVGDIGGGFYLFGQTRYYEIKSWGVTDYSYTNYNDPATRNIYFNGTESLNNGANVVTTADSVFVYSNTTGMFDPAFCLGINKADRKTKQFAVPTNRSNNGVFRSKITPANIYTFGAMDVQYALRPAVAKLAGPVGATQWLFQYPKVYGAFTRCVEDAQGHIIALLRFTDSVMVFRLDRNTGKPMWTYGMKVTSNIRAYDLQVNDENNMVIVALLQHSADWKQQNSSYLELNATNGRFVKEVKMEGDPGTQNNILFLRNLPGAGIFMGGNLNRDSLGGPNGFTFLNKDQASVDTLPVCNLKTAFDATIDSLQSLKVSFKDRSTGGTPLRYRWTFGDGTTADTTARPVHTYSAAGAYNVCLQVADANNCLASYCDTVRVKVTPPPVVCNLQGYFQYVKQRPDSAVIKFTDRSTGGKYPLSYTWNFGDGSANATTADPLHSFANTGIYHVCLAVRDSAGCTSSYCEDITVVRPVDTSSSCNVTAGFRYEPAAGTPAEVHFFNLSNPDTAKLRWNFGDGSLPDSSNTSVHIFASPGSYNVCLTASAKPGCQQTYCDTVTVSPTVAPLRVTASPNPATTTLYLDFVSDAATNVTIICTNAYGDQKYYQVISVVAGRNRVGVPVASFSQGIYFVTISGKGINSKTKFVKL